jgi:Family of unknown function (DUF5946)
VTQEMHCPECQAALSGDRTCQDNFYQMGFWELENPAVYGIHHHLMVLCFHLQHPSLYSQQGLRGALLMLVEFIEQDVTPQEMRRRIRPQVDSQVRKFKITRTPENHGEYLYPVIWEMTSAGVVSGGIDNFVNNENIWAKSVYNSLKSSGNLPVSASYRIFNDNKP